MRLKLNLRPFEHYKEDESLNMANFLPDFTKGTSVLHLMLLVELVILMLELSIDSNFDIDWQLVGVRSFFIQIVVLSSVAINRFLLSFYPRGSHLKTALFALISVTTATLVISVLSQIIFPGVFPEEYLWLLRNLSIAFLLTFILLRYFFILNHIKILERNNLESSLDSLRARIRPHFLFNALNSIAGLIFVDQKKAEKAIENLASLFRSSLKTSELHETVNQEIERCELYLAIEALRFGDRLKVKWTLDEEVHSLPMPAMILQPLIENSVYHGISELPQGGTIKVNVALVNKKILLDIENPMSENKACNPGLNIALDNIARRLKALYADSVSFSTSINSGIFSVQLRYPIVNQA